jgi:ATP-dependent Clp protease ATP-binding subunit ClpA
VDEVIYFNQLTEENFRQIAQIMLEELKNTLADKGLSFSWDEELLDHLVKHSFSSAYGARNLRRYIQKHVEDPIATQIIESYLNPVKNLKAIVVEDKISLLAL